jgi:hypothetical protein
MAACARGWAQIRAELEIKMKRWIGILLVLCCLSFAMTAYAQDNTMKPDTMAPDTTGKATRVTGKISADGKTFVSDSDSKSWTISNPDAVKGHEGHHVTLKAHINADKNEVHVVSLKMVNSNMDNMK